MLKYVQISFKIRSLVLCHIAGKLTMPYDNIVKINNLLGVLIVSDS